MKLGLAALLLTGLIGSNGWQFRVVYVAEDGTRTRTAWSECFPPPVDPPHVTPPREGSVIVKVRECEL